jgi:hypothetical protein
VKLITMTDRNFYIDLPSNVPYPNNKPQNFTTKLKHPIKLNGDWEVALVAITYPNNAYNLSEDCDVEVKMQDKKHFITGAPIKLKFTIQKGKYDMLTLIEVMKYQASLVWEEASRNVDSDLIVGTTRPNEFTFVKPYFDRVSEPLTIRFNKYNKTVTLSTCAPEAYIKFSSIHLMRALGFMHEPNEHIQLPATSSKECTLVYHLPGICVYTNIITSTMIGDSFGKLLQYVPLICETEIGYKEYKRPRFVPLQSNFIEEIQIRLTDASGKDLIFPTGKTHLSLEFRPCRL